MPIRQLPLQLANQIAAGEVVERPSSVIKELVENSIDAGATELVIDIEQGGAKRIRVRDNGGGIEKDELSLALSRHATSKIHCLDDLESIESLGFRGEALASISSVSRLTLTSKPADQSEAWQAFCEGRDMEVQVQPAAHPDGTTVDVQDLFFNTPARRKFLRTEKTEFGHIDEVLRRIALAAPHVRIVLTHNKRKIRDYRPLRHSTEDYSQATPRLKAIVGSTFANQALFLEQQSERWRIYGWIAPADHCRHQGDIQYMYVNGRMMKDKLLNHAIRQAYGEQLAADRQPTYVLYLQVPAREVDVNVHPAKHEVRFHQARQIHDFVLLSLRQALTSYHNTEHANDAALQAAAPTAGYQPPAPHAYHKPAHEYHKPDVAPIPVPDYANSAQHQTPEAASTAAVSARADTAISNAQVDIAETTHWRCLQVLEQRTLLLLRSSEAGPGQTVTQQLATADIQRVHAAVEQQRIAKNISQGLSGQPLLLPVQLALDEPLPSATNQQLARLGVQLKPLQGNRVVVMQVPAMLRQQPTEQVISELLAQLTDAALERQSTLHAWLAQFCIQPAYSNQQGEYWLAQAQALADAGALSLTDLLTPLDWKGN